MPAKDNYHDTVINAPRKDGWRIVSEQFSLVVDKRRLWIDIHASTKTDNRAILVEVKGFELMPSP